LRKEIRYDKFLFVELKGVYQFGAFSMFSNHFGALLHNKWTNQHIKETSFVCHGKGGFCVVND